MIEMQWIINEKTGERQLHYRHNILCVDASGALCPTDKKSQWYRVPEKTIEESSIDDLIESGGIANAP